MNFQFIWEISGNFPRFLNFQKFATPIFAYFRSLGCTFVEMLVGKPPNSDCASAKDVYVRVVMKEQLIYQLPDGVSSECCAFIKALLTHDPKKRPSSSDALELPYMLATPGTVA